MVFILWGNDAKKKKKLLTKTNCLIIESPHPSPLSSYRGFFGSTPFSKTNQYLKEHKIKIIDWKLGEKDV
jgi:uracil-DNA glycosylase